MDFTAIYEWIDNSDVTEATKISYKRKLNALRRFDTFETSPIMTVEANYTNLNTSVDLIKTLLRIHRLCPHYTIVDEELEYGLLLCDSLQDQRVEAYEKRERRSTDVDWADVQAIEPNLKSQDLLLYRCFTHLPPQRNADFSNVRLVDVDDGKGNVYDRSQCAFVFRKYKTARARGAKVVPVPNSIASIIPRAQLYLFEHQNGGPVGYQRLSNRVNYLFTKHGLAHVGAISLRRSYASQQLKSGMTGVELATAAAAMDHTSRMHKFYAFT